MPQMFNPAGIIGEDGDIVTVRTAQGETLPLSKTNPAHAGIIDSYRGTGSMQAAPVASANLNQQPPAAIPAAEVPMGVSATPAMSAPMPDPMALPGMAMKQSESIETQSRSMRPQDQKKLEQATQKVIKAEETKASADIAKAQAETELYTNQAADLKAQNDMIVAREAERQAKANEMLQSIQAKSDEVASMKVDPDYFGRMDTGNKILAAVSIGLGALGSAMQGSGQNPAMDVVQKAIDRDIDAQKANIANKRASAESARGNYSDFLKLIGDERGAELSERNRILDTYKAQMLQAQSSNASEQSKAALAQNIAAVEQEQAKNIAELNQIVSKKVVENEASPQNIKRPEWASNEVQQKILNSEDGLRQMDDLINFARDKEGKIGPVAGRLNALAAQMGVADGDTAALQAAIISAAAAKTKAISGAATTDAEYARLSSILGSLKDNPEAFFKKMDAEKRRLEQTLDSTRDAYKGVAQLPNPTYQTSRDKQQSNAKYGFKKQ